MSKVRILGARDRLEDVLRVLQDLSLLHLSAPETVSLERPELRPDQERERRHLQIALDNVEQALAALDIREGGAAAGPASRADLVRWARVGWRVRRETERLAAKGAALEEERALIMKYQHFFSAFRALLESESRWPNATAYHVLLRGSETGTLPQLRASLAAVIGEEFQLYSQPLPSGELAVLIVVSAQAAGRVERLLAEARVQEIPVPEAYGGKSLTTAIPKMLDRLGQIPRDMEEVKRRRQVLVRAARGGPAASAGRVARSPPGPRGPAAHRRDLARLRAGRVGAGRGRNASSSDGLRSRFGEDVVVSEVCQGGVGVGGGARGARATHGCFRPFETVVRLHAACRATARSIRHRSSRCSSRRSSG